MGERGSPNPNTSNEEGRKKTITISERNEVARVSHNMSRKSVALFRVLYSSTSFMPKTQRCTDFLHFSFFFFPCLLSLRFLNPPALM